MQAVLKIVYNPFVNYLLRNVSLLISKFTGKQLITVSGKISLDYKGIPFHLHTNQTCYVTKVLFYEGTENYEFTPILINMIKKSKVFFDIGANIGYFSVLSSKVNPELKTLAFEPSKGPLHYLKKNVASNGLENVKVIGKAVADIDGELEFHDVTNPKYPWLEHYLNGSNSLQNKHGKNKTQSYKVSTTTLSKVIKDFSIDQIDLIKLDTEFTEHIILKNSLEVIKEFRPIIISEIYTEIENEVQVIIENLENYSFYHIDEKNKISPIKSLSEIERNAERNFIFCPSEKTQLLD